LDSGTECYYYWNTKTNAVTWEIPSEYSQYLLQVKEYDEKLAKYEKAKSDWDKKDHKRQVFFQNLTPFQFISFETFHSESPGRNQSKSLLKRAVMTM
jgi:hypothetical protein